MRLATSTTETLTDLTTDLVMANNNNTRRPFYRDARLHVVEPPRERSFIWQIQDHRQVDRVFFMESSQLYAATLTHYSTEPLTTGPNYDPLLLLLALAGDVHPNPGSSRYPCSVCFKNVTCQGTSYLCTICSHLVHSRCSGLRYSADYRKAYG